MESGHNIYFINSHISKMTYVSRNEYLKEQNDKGPDILFLHLLLKKCIQIHRGYFSGETVAGSA